MMFEELTTRFEVLQVGARRDPTIWIQRKPSKASSYGVVPRAVAPVQYLSPSAAEDWHMSSHANTCRLRICDAECAGLWRGAQVWSVLVVIALS
jgi:hypothetical protein